MYRLRLCARLTTKLCKPQDTVPVYHRNISRWIRPTLIELTHRKKRWHKPIRSPRNEFIEWNREAEVYAFNNRLSEKFDLNLLERAFTHRSYVIQEEEEQKKVGIDNPMLDFEDNLELISEGKEITPLLIENYLHSALPLAPLECIHAFKNYLLSNEVLAATSSGIGTKDLVLTQEYPVDEETLANTFYALISALNRSVNLEHAGIFVRDILISRLAEKDLIELWSPENPLEILNDILIRESRKEAEPRVIAQTGINTLLPVYHIAVYSNKEFLGSGIGETVDEGVSLAALNALLRMFGLLDSSNPLRCNLKIDEPDSKNLPLQEWSRSKI
ncbi:hypothetical protein QAD02_011196 [Eretmocerus hayati]|uniref:Uncharacterized protein n=1 Tax=Eretmocerus hayati TaxID=131215 RepID=A0ACC2NW38_9HYME|nr:hypothetical protein QAD02_011196 [Eretmocerus hayati]